jgi:predicted acyl esterase
MTAPSHPVAVEFDVPARMRDGVTLRADVYRPLGAGPWPTLLTRSPYCKDDPLVSATLDPVAAARAGFMVVVQDVRGRFASEGEWSPFEHERRDGRDTVEWAARLPGSNGRVGMYGGSYCGVTQWLAAVERPPSLAAIAPLATWSEPLDGLFARGGALELGIALPWALATGAAQLARRGRSDDERRTRLGELLDAYDRLATDGYRELPVVEDAVCARYGVRDLGALRSLDDPRVAGWCRVAGRHHRVGVPTLHVGGWHDLFLQGTLDNYVAMAELGRPARLVVGPWAHGDTKLSGPTGQLSFGIRSHGLGMPVTAEGDVNEMQLAWFRRALDPRPAEAPRAEPSPAEAPRAELPSAEAPPAEPPPSEAPVRIFVMGRNAWRDESSWPLERARVERWFLRAGGALRADGPDPRDGASTFAYDPSDPVPTCGGSTSDIPHLPPGPFDQAAVEARRDVLVFTSEPLRDELEVTGRVRAVLHVESSASSMDWVARLCDVHPDGRSFNVCDGIVRVAEGADACRRVELDLWSTCNVFLPGHRLRVHVTSSSFPRWDRNLNTGDQRSPRMVVARQRLHHDAQRPSWIELPVVA